MPYDFGFPLAYLLTFSCYGNRLRGDARGSVDRRHNLVDTPYLPVSNQRVDSIRGSMIQAPYKLDGLRRRLVLDAIQKVCTFRSWTLFAAHIRSVHVHCVIGAEEVPEKIMNTLKAYASRKLNRAGIDDPNRKRWSRHGSTRYLWDIGNVSSAVDYVVNQQGEPLEVYVDEQWQPSPDLPGHDRKRVGNQRPIVNGE